MQLSIENKALCMPITANETRCLLQHQQYELDHTTTHTTHLLLWLLPTLRSAQHKCGRLAACAAGIPLSCSPYRCRC